MVVMVVVVSLTQRRLILRKIKAQDEATKQRKRAGLPELTVDTLPSSIATKMMNLDSYHPSYPQIPKLPPLEGYGVDKALLRNDGCNSLCKILPRSTLQSYNGKLWMRSSIWSCEPFSLFNLISISPFPLSNPRQCLTKRMAKLQAGLERFKAAASLSTLQTQSLVPTGNLLHLKSYQLGP